MKLGILKTILLENNVNQIYVNSKFHVKPLVVIDAVFDQKTRDTIFLKVDKNAPPRTNKTSTIKSYLLDFKDSHKIIIEDLSRGNKYLLSTNFELDKNSGFLYLQIE